MERWDVVSLERFAAGDRWGMLLCFLLLCLYTWYLGNQSID
jgi:hypothetical protein